MAFERAVLDLPGFLAGEDFSPSGSLTGTNGSVPCGQYLIVKQNPNNVALNAVHCSAHTDRPLGISQNDPPSGDGLSIMSMGVSKVTAGATLVPGQAYGTDAAGRAVPKNETSTGANYGDFVLGQVIEGAGVGELATVTVNSPYRI